jgi:SagB-type dehydrogenase family enzyme
MKALDYHQATKHSLARLHANPHRLDFANMPRPFKIYSDLERRPLPAERRDTGVPALNAVASPGSAASGERVPGVEELARILASVGITRRRAYPGGEMQFRGASCTGALYHIEIYVVCGDLAGLPAGVHQFQAHDFSICTLRSGDHRHALIEASDANLEVATAPAVLVLTSTWWRNAWKYQARMYRHAWWDSGCMAANLLAMAAALDLPASVVLGFADEPVNRLLDVDPAHEAALALIPLGRGGAAAPAPGPAIAALGLTTEPLSQYEVAYPEIAAAHAATSLASGAAAWRGGLEAVEAAPPEAKLVTLEPMGDDALPQESVDAVIHRRGSTRRFARKELSFAQLSTILERTTGAIPADFIGPSGGPLTELYLIVHAVDGVTPGTYAYRRKERALEPLRQGDFRQQAGALGLGQELPADASFNIYYLSDLDAVVGRFGERGYRAAQIEGGILGGKAYLASYALGCGATGLTFIDDDVTEFFSPHAAGKSVMFLMAIGRPRRREDD